jgi:predicted XRE-type DNA-binding protein
MNDGDRIKHGSKNVFADIGNLDAVTHLLKAQLVTRIRDILTASEMTQTDAAERLRLSQPDASRLLRGQFRDVSVERLIRMLTKLGCDVDIVIREPRGAKSKIDTIRLLARTT